MAQKTTLGIDFYIPSEPKLAKTPHLTPPDHLANQALNQHQKSFDIAHQAPKNGSKMIGTLITSSSQKWLLIDMYTKIIWLSVQALRI